MLDPYKAVTLHDEDRLEVDTLGPPRSHSKNRSMVDSGGELSSPAITKLKMYTAFDQSFMVNRASGRAEDELAPLDDPYVASLRPQTQQNTSLAARRQYGLLKKLDQGKTRGSIDF